VPMYRTIEDAWPIPPAAVAKGYLVALFLNSGAGFSLCLTGAGAARPLSVGAREGHRRLPTGRRGRRRGAPDRQMELAIVTLPPAVLFGKSGEIKVIAVTSAKRSGGDWDEAYR
jgi:hypothetical protein